MRLRIPTKAQLAQVYETDLTASFPAAELKPLRAIEEMWRDGVYEPWCLFDDEDKIVGECFLWLGKPGWALLDYLCVSSECRNGGIGAVLLKKMRETRPEWTILAESEAAEDAPDPAMAARRLGFYERNAARFAGYDTEAFGVHYRTIYWGPAPVEDAELMTQHEAIYRGRFSPEKYARYLRIPLRAEDAPLPKVPWDE